MPSILRLSLALVIFSTACTTGLQQNRGKALDDDAQSTQALVNIHDQPLLNIDRLTQNRAAAKKIIPYLQHEQAMVRVHAMLALARVADPAASSAELYSLANDRNSFVRSLAAFALGQLDPQLPLLMDQLDAGHRGTEAWVGQAARLRAKIERGLDARLHIEQNPQVREALYAALGRIMIGPGLHHILVGLGVCGDEAAWAAMAYGQHATRRKSKCYHDDKLDLALIKLAQAEQKNQRFAALYALVRARRPAAEQVFLQTLNNDPKAELRAWAARGLAFSPAPNQKISDALHAALKDSSWQVQVEALRSLRARQKRGEKIQKSKFPIYAQALVTSLFAQDRSAGVEMALLASLPLQSDALLQQTQNQLALHTDDRLSQGLACQVAVEQSSRTMNFDYLQACAVFSTNDYTQKKYRLTALLGAIKRDPQQRQALTPYLRESDPRLRAQALMALATARDINSLTEVRRLLREDTDVTIVEIAADILAKLEANPDLVDDIRAALQRLSKIPKSAESISAQVALAKALAVHGHKTAQAEIKKMLQQSPWQVRRALRKSLGLAPVFGEISVSDDDLPYKKRNDKELKAIIHCEHGDIHLQLLSREAPRSVDNFIRLARLGFFNGLNFHRVIPDFIVQGGDPRGDGYGGPGYHILDELSPRKFNRGSVGMALSGPDTGGSQFFITQSRQPHLDGHYTLFAKVTQGQDIVDSLLPGTVIRSIEIIENP